MVQDESLIQLIDKIFYLKMQARSRRSGRSEWESESNFREPNFRIQLANTYKVTVNDQQLFIRKSNYANLPIYSEKA